MEEGNTMGGRGLRYLFRDSMGVGRGPGAAHGLRAPLPGSCAHEHAHVRVRDVDTSAVPKRMRVHSLVGSWFSGEFRFRASPV